MRLKVAMALLIALAFMATSAGSTLAESGSGWLGGSGQNEPNTNFDTGEYMWQDANAAAEDRIYFNGVLVRYSPAERVPITQTHVEGNYGLTTDAQLDGGTMVTGIVTRGMAVLGYWRDCNDDAYIGNKLVPASIGNWGSYPLAQYASEVDTTVCPSESRYNDGTWITEFRPVGPEAMGQSFDEDKECTEDSTRDECLEAVEDAFLTRKGTHAVNDDLSRVWMDWGLPEGEAAEVRNLQERGWLQTSDGTLRWVDFWTGNAIQDLSANGRSIDVNGVTLAQVPATGFWDAKPNVGDCERDENGRREFGSGSTNTCGLYPLYQVKRLVNDSDHEEGDAEAAVYVFKEDSSCGQNSERLFDDVHVDDDTTISGTVYYKEVKPDTHPNALVEGSIGGTVINVLEGFNNYNATSGECEEDHEVQNLELGVSQAEKRIVDTPLLYKADRRTRALEAAGYDDAAVDGMGGLRGGYWESYWGFITVPPDGGTATFTRFEITFYGFVSGAALTNGGATDSALPGGGQEFEYGAEQCDGVYNDPNLVSPGRWLCDQAAWEQQKRDDQIEGEYAWPIIGDAYNLRDIDCYDGTLFRQDVAGTRLAPQQNLAATTCADAPFDE